MLRATSTAGRVSALVTSAALHVGAAAVFVVHGAGTGPRPDARGARAEAFEAEVEVAPLPVADVASPAPLAEPSRPVAAPPVPPARAAVAALSPPRASAPAPPATDGLAPSPAPDAAAEAPVRFTMTIAPGAAVASAAPAVPGVAATGAPTGPFAERAVDTPARLLHGAPPPYPPAARAAEVEADVPLEIVVDASGSVVTARPLARVGYGFEDFAQAAVRGFRFVPARMGAAAVAVRMRWVVSYRLE